MKKTPKTIKTSSQATAPTALTGVELTQVVGGQDMEPSPYRLPSRWRW